MVRVRALSRHYGPVAALNHIDLDVASGERLALLGKSGSGKSTLLHILGGLDHPTAGLVEVAGRDLTRLGSLELAEHRLNTVGIVFQAFNLITSRTALQNVELPLVFAGVPVNERRQRALAALESVGLGSRLRHSPGELSGGEMQRVAIARALVNEPKVLLADEPTGNLDSTTAKGVMDLLLSHVRKHGTTLILITHDEELARQSAQRIVRLQDGRIV